MAAEKHVLIQSHDLQGINIASLFGPDIRHENIMTRASIMSRIKNWVASAALVLALPVCAQQGITYDFAFYSGAGETWVYEAGAKVFVEVYEDTSTPESDVLFKVRNGIDTELGYESRIRDMQIDTGTLAADMFSSVSLAEVSAGVRYFMYTPNVDRTTLLDLSSNIIRFTGDYAAGVVNNPTTADGIHPGEYIVLRARLKEGLTFADVINAMNVGASTTYVEGHLGDWTTQEQEAYRTGAPQGLRFTLLLQSIVPDWWNSKGHGLFVIHRLAASTDPRSPVISSVTATPATLPDTGTSQLSVVASDPDGGPQPLFYLWTVVSGGGMLNDPMSATPIYTPENVTDTRTVTLQVDVSDGEATISRTLTLQVNDADAPPPNAAPQISELKAMPATLVDTETSQLSVTATDPDLGPQPLTYQWSIVSGGGVLDDSTSAMPVYTPADVVGTQIVALRVVVSDAAASTSGDLTLTVEDATAPPPGVELLSEDFSGSSLAGWTVHDEGTVNAPSKWKLSQGRLFQNSNIGDSGTTADLARLGTYLSYDDGLGWTDYRLKFTMLTTASGNVMGVMFRHQNADNYYRFTWDKKLNQRRLVKKSGGVFTLLAADNVPYVSYQTYQMEIVVLGSQIEVWIDGARIFQVTDTDHKYGSFAFHTWKNGWAYFDDVVVEDLSGGTFNVAPKITAATASPADISDIEISNLTVDAYDEDNGPAALSYQWTILDGGGVLDNATSASPIYTPADVTSTESVKLRVQVSDGKVAASSDLTILVRDANAPPLGPEVLSEDFSGSSLAGWTVHDEGTVNAPSKWKLSQGRLFQNSNIGDSGTTADLARLGTYLSYDDGLGWTDYRLKFTMLTTASGNVMGVMFRHQNADNYYRFTWDKKLNQRRLVKKSGGVFTLLAADNVPYVSYQTYQMEIVVLGSQIEVWIDGARIFQVTDTDHKYGSFAFHTWKNAWAYFDDVVVNSFVSQ
jgi:hypothetical protein